MKAPTAHAYCPRCGAEVPVERRFPRAGVLLVLLMLVSVAITLLFFPRFVFLFLVLPFGFGLWRKQPHCARCGQRLRRSG